MQCIHLEINFVVNERNFLSFATSLHAKGVSARVQKMLKAIYE